MSVLLPLDRIDILGWKDEPLILDLGKQTDPTAADAVVIDIFGLFERAYDQGNNGKERENKGTKKKGEEENLGGDNVRFELSSGGAERGEIHGGC